MSLIEAKAVWKRTDFFFSSRRRHTRWTGDWKFRRVLFRSYADSGMIPWLLVTEIMSQRKSSLSQLVGERMRAFPASGEINRRVSDAPSVIASVERKYTPNAVAVDRTDGLSVEFAKWRFNLRSSNTEPLL